MLLFGRSQTTTFLMPRFFGFTMTLSSRISPLARHAGPLRPAIASGLRTGIWTPPGSTTCPSIATHALYLFGFDETRDAPRTFKIDRIRDLSVTTRTYDPPRESVEDAFTNAWDIIADQPVVDVVVRFDSAIAARVREATWHPSQRVEAQTDGSLIWRGRVSGTIEIRLWILSWGSQVEVLEPADLRADVASTYRAAAARYALEDDAEAAGGTRPAHR